MKSIIITFFVMCMITFAGKTIAHEHHTKVIDSSQHTTTATQTDSGMERSMAEHRQMQAVDAFPNYHPLIVHFPIVLLLMAALFQLFSFWIYKKEFSVVTVILLSLGLISAWLASNVFHAHPAQLTGIVSDIFETHEQMASLAFWFGLGALVAKILSLTILKRKWWIESTVMLLLLTSSVTVSIAGHHGAMLVHMNGIGVMGSHLESDNIPEHPANSSSLPFPPSTSALHNEHQTGQRETEHNQNEEKTAPHGGVIREAGEMHIEMVAENKDLVFYLLDAQAKPVPMKNVTGSVTIRTAGNMVKTIDLMMMSGKLTAMQAGKEEVFTATCTLTNNGKSYSATFDSNKDLPAKNHH